MAYRKTLLGLSFAMLINSIDIGRAYLDYNTRDRDNGPRAAQPLDLPCSVEVRKKMKEVVDPRKEGTNRLGMDVKEPKRKRPVMTIYDKIVQEIYKRNMKKEHMEEETKEYIKIRNRKGKQGRRKKLGTFIVECSGRIMNAPRKKKKNFIG
ncbi:hypothetical protein J6590_066357 [Homalodisca vitripennis]|nr:hypothetical protein J6590_066357 [Homalodisca vitripennis]